MAKRKHSSAPSGTGAKRPARRHARPQQDGRVWLFGVHAVVAALANPARCCHRLLMTEAVSRSWDHRPGAGMPDGGGEIADRDAISRLLPTGAVHQGVAVEADTLPAVLLSEVCAGSGPVVILDQATDPRNVGAVLRSAAAFGATAVVASRRHAPEPSGTLAKAASGALETVPLSYVPNLVRALKALQDAGFWCVGLDSDAARTINEAATGGRTALVIGSEGAGLRRLTRQACDDLARIPMRGAIASLNLSAAAAIALYEVTRDRSSGGDLK